MKYYNDEEVKYIRIKIWAYNIKMYEIKNDRTNKKKRLMTYRTKY